MKKYLLDLTVTAVERLTDRHVLLRLTGDSQLPEARPGQFVEVRIDHEPSTFLRRPISINNIDRARNELWLLVAAIGNGTRRLAQVKVGEQVNCLMPLGNWFTVASSLSPSLPQGKGALSGSTPPLLGGQGEVSGEALLIGGGVGMAPMYFIGKTMVEEGRQPTFLLGARTAADVLLLDRFRELGPVYVTTEDGSMGVKGFVTDHPILKSTTAYIATCGPKPMMMAVARHAKAHGIPCEVSLENMMACGLGACLCCVEKTVKGNLCVCKEGPVFNINELLWQI